jgi:hypothetical protein
MGAVGVIADKRRGFSRHLQLQPTGLNHRLHFVAPLSRGRGVHVRFGSKAEVRVARVGHKRARQLISVFFDDRRELDTSR